jgi:hypothetical protein
MSQRFDDELADLENDSVAIQVAMLFEFHDRTQSTTRCCTSETGARARFVELDALWGPQWHTLTVPAKAARGLV